MRFFAILVCLCYALVAPAQDSPETYGKSASQIVKMGRHAWEKFYYAHAGESTADMSAAAASYGWALQVRNEQLLKRQTTAKRKLIGRLRGLMEKFSSAGVDAAYQMTGGGTMWNPVYAGTTADVEEVVFALLGGHSKPPKHMVVSSVTPVFDSLEANFKRMRDDPDNREFFKYDEAMKAVSTMRSSYTEIVAYAARLSRADSDRLLGFCKSYADLGIQPQ